MHNKIMCPKCGNEIEITEVMSAQLAAEIRQEFQAAYDTKNRDLVKHRESIERQQAEIDQARETLDQQVRDQVEQHKASLLERARLQAFESVSVELKDRDEQIKAYQGRLKEADDKELVWRKRERDLQDWETRLANEQEDLQEQIKRQLDDQRHKILEQARKNALEELSIDLKDRDARVADLEAKLKQASQTELVLRKRERDLKDKADQLEVEVTRRVEAEHDRIREAARQQADEAHHLKDAEKEKKISDLVKQIDELKRKAEQGSQQTQGEVMEIALEELLRRTFPHDVISDVPKGIGGGDVLQRVRTGSDGDCGTILWEAKRTKNWSDQWLPKLRKDQRDAKAAVAILVTTVLPEGVAHLAHVDGIWICDWSCAGPVAAALRTGLLEAARVRRAIEGQQGKMEQVYEYLASPQFRNRVAGIAEPFITMKKDLDAERRSIEKQWAKREKQIEQAIKNTVGMYGDFQGIIGGVLPEIEGMSLLQLEARSCQSC